METETETESKKASHGVDHESESVSSHAAIHLLPPEMLQSIFEFLPFKDLLTCREVSKRWKSVATDPVQKRCAPLAFSRRDIPKSQRSRAIQSFCQLIRVTNEQGDLGEFPVTTFRLDFLSNYYWNEMDGSESSSQFLEAVSPFVKHINFCFHVDEDESLEVPCLAKALTFPNLTKITLEVVEHQNKDSETYSFVRKVIEKCPNIEELHLHLYEVRRSGAIRRCIVETGIEQKTSLVTSLSINAPRNERDFEYLNQLGYKLKYFRLGLIYHNVSKESFTAFLESQSDTLTSFNLALWSESGYQRLRELPCLPHLKNLSVWCSASAKKEEEQFPTLFYKKQLPALKKLDLAEARFAADYLMASHLAPSESLRELILPERGIEDAGEVIRQAARLFPNLKKLKVFCRSMGPYMRDVYEELPGIEELCITIHGYGSVDDIITGLPERLFNKIRNKKPPSYHFSKALAMLERRTTKTLACLKNLKILLIHRDQDDDDDDEGIRGVDFTELSAVVLKQMKCLQYIDFGIRKYGPNVSAALKEDLEAHGIKLLYRRPRFIRPRTDFIVSLTDESETDSSDIDSDSN